MAVFALALGAGLLRRLLAMVASLAAFGAAVLTTYLTVGPYVFAAMVAMAFALGIYALVAPPHDSPAV